MADLGGGRRGGGKERESYVNILNRMDFLENVVARFTRKRESIASNGQELRVGVGEKVHVGRNPQESKKLRGVKLGDNEKIVKLDPASCGIEPKDVSRLCVSIGVGQDGRLGVEMDPKCSNKVTVVLSASDGLSEEIDSGKVESRARDIRLRADGSNRRQSLMKIRVAAGEKFDKYIDLVCVGRDENGEYRFVVVSDEKKETKKSVVKEKSMGLEEVYGEPPEVVEYQSGRKMYVYSGEGLAGKDERPWGRWHVARIGTKGGDLYMIVRTATGEAHDPMDAVAVVPIEKGDKTIINYMRADGVTTIAGVEKERNRSGLFAEALVKHTLVVGLEAGMERAKNKTEGIQTEGSATFELGQVSIGLGEYEVRGQICGATRGKFSEGSNMALSHVGDAGTSAIYEGRSNWVEIPEASERRSFTSTDRGLDVNNLTKFDKKGNGVEGWISATDGGLFVGFDRKLQRARLMSVLDVCRSHAEGRITGNQLAELLRESDGAFSATDDVSMLVFVPNK